MPTTTSASRFTSIAARHLQSCADVPHAPLVEDEDQPGRRMRFVVVRVMLVAAALCVGLLQTPAAQPAAPTTFTDVTTAAGVRFKHQNGAFGKKYLPETMGAG